MNGISTRKYKLIPKIHRAEMAETLQNMSHHQRIVFLDFARGLAIVFMIIMHAMIVYEVHGGLHSLLGTLILLLGAPSAAPVFMLIMGVFFGRSKVQGLRYGVIRGLKLVALGYVLSLLRFSLPRLIGEAYGASLQEDVSARFQFFTVDILQMAGLSLIVLALVRHLLPWRFVWVLLAIFVAVISPLLSGALGQCPGTSLLWGTSENVFFPMFPWVIYPLVGMFCSQHLLNCSDIGSLMKKWALLGLAITIVGGLLWATVPNSIAVEGDYFWRRPTVHLVVLGFVFIWLPLCWWIVTKVRDNAAFRMLYLWSKNVTIVYFVQWVLIGWGMLVFGYMERSASTALIIGIAAIFATHVLTRAYLRFRHLLKTSATD